MHHIDIEFFFGRSGFNQLLHVFDRNKSWSKIEGTSCPIKLKPELLEVLQNMKSTSQKGQLLKFDGKRVQRPRRSRLHLVPYNARRTLAEHVDTNPRLNVEAMKQGVESLNMLIANPRGNGGLYAGSVDEMRKYAMTTARRRYPQQTIAQVRHSAGIILNDAWQIRRQQLRKLIKSVDSEGRLQHAYKESENGRRFGMGLHLQSMPKLVSQTALAGCTEYDIHACHYSILEHVAKVAQSTHSVTIEHDLISDYVAKKDDRRLELKTRLCKSGLPVTLAQAKTLFARLPCGGSLRDIGGNDVDEMLGKQKHILFADEYYAALHDQVGAVSRFMIGSKFAPVEKHNQVITNAVDLKMQKGRPNPELKAFMLFGLERLIINAGMEAHADGLQLPVLDKHDAWVTVEPQSPEDAIQAIKNVTGINVQINRPMTYLPDYQV